MMKYFIVLLLGIGLSSYCLAQDNFFDQADRFFLQHVKNKLVDYDQIRENPSELNELIKYIEQNSSLTINSDTEKALAINAYNLYVIKGIIAEQEINSPLEISGFFDNKIYKYGGKTVSLNDLEKDILLKQTEDARLHFVLVCAARSCPPLIPASYKPETLNAQLDAQTSLAVNDPEFTRVDNSNRSVQLSKIFDWYRSDFLKKQPSLIAFLNEYRDRAISPGYKVNYYDYDWTINKIGQKQSIGFTKAVPSSTSNLLEFTPSQLFGFKQFEVNFFNNLYTENAVRNSEGDKAKGNERANILTSNIQFTYGVSKKGKINAGIDLVVSAGSEGPDNNSLFHLFNGNSTKSGIAISLLGPRIKYQPIRRWQFFSMQHTFLFPVSQDLAGVRDNDAFLALDRYQWRNQLFYDIRLNDKFRLFYELAFNYLIVRDESKTIFPTNFIDIPSSLFLNYFPTDQFSFFVSGQYAPRLGNTDDEDPKNFGLLQWITNVGVGAKYQATEELGFELSYGNFIGGAGFQDLEAGAGELINFGIRYIK